MEIHVYANIYGVCIYIYIYIYCMSKCLFHVYMLYIRNETCVTETTQGIHVQKMTRHYHSYLVLPFQKCFGSHATQMPDDVQVSMSAGCVQTRIALLCKRSGFTSARAICMHVSMYACMRVLYVCRKDQDMTSAGKLCAFILFCVCVCVCMHACIMYVRSAQNSRIQQLILQDVFFHAFLCVCVCIHV